VKSRAGQRVLRSTAIVSAGTTASRLLGFAREVLMAVFFGTTLAKSAFDVAFKIPNLFRRLFGEGALSAAFVPIFAESLEKDGITEANRFAGKIMTMLGVSLACIVIGGILLCAAAIKALPLGEKAAAVLPLLVIMLPYLFFICLVALCMGILNTFHHFALPALTPVLLNIAWIAALLFVCPRFGETPAERIYGVAWMILAAGAVQLAVQIPVLRRFGIRPRLILEWRDRNVGRVLALMGPAALGMGVHQVNVVIDNLLALWVGTWAPAALTYAERLIYLPLGIFATALGTVLLPTFSRQAARERPGDIKSTLRKALENLLLIMCPAAVGLMVLAGPVVRLAFVWRGGLFDIDSTTATARALIFYGPGLVVFSLYKVLVPVFYALKDTKTPVRVGLVMVAANLVMNVAFVLTWPVGYKHAGLACATVLSSALNVMVLGRILHRRLGDPGWRSLLDLGWRTLSASLVMGAAAMTVHRLFISLEQGMMPTKPADLAALVGAIGVGMLIYAVLIALLCRRQAAEIVRRLRGRRSRLP